MMKRFLAAFIAIILGTSSLVVFANYTEYSESVAYAELADRISGCDAIGAFVDYKTLVDRHMKKLSSMNSAERQRLITEILTDAGAIYVSDEAVDFTDGELAEYCLYAAANVAEAKNYLRHHGMSSIADVPLTVDFGSQSNTTVTFFKSFLATAYNSGVSDILIKNNGVGIMLDIAELASVLQEAQFSVSLMRRNTEDLAQEYKDATKSDFIYQLILTDDNELHQSLPNSKMMFYGAVDDDRVYCLASGASGVKTKSVSTNYDGSIISFPVNSVRWFGIYKEDALSFQEFTDVGIDHWAYEYIDYLAENDIVSGGDGKFNPDDSVTREEFIKMLTTALNIQDSSARCVFDDVAVDAWYYSAVASAYEKGIANGMSEKLFGVGENISRQDIAVMAVRALDYKQIALEPTLSYYGYFFDGESISDYAQDAVMTMYVAGFISDDEDYRFNPQAPATRAEVAKIIYMIIDYIERI